MESFDAVRKITSLEISYPLILAQLEDRESAKILHLYKFLLLDIHMSGEKVLDDVHCVADGVQGEHK